MGLRHRHIAALVALLLAHLGPGGGSPGTALAIEPSAEAEPMGAPIQPAEAPATAIGELPEPDRGRGAAIGGILLLADTPEQAAMALDALHRFAEFGLELPPGLEIHFHDDLESCGGHRGLATHGTDLERIDMCRTHQFTLMHEMAHMWAEHTLTDRQRQAFLDERGLRSWRDGAPWEERGTEHAAHAIAWGLGDRPIPLAEIPDTSFDRMTAAFELLTGHTPGFTQNASGSADERPAEPGAQGDESSSRRTAAQPR
jgi:hypothetical protein